MGLLPQNPKLSEFGSPIGQRQCHCCSSKREWAFALSRGTSGKESCDLAHNARRIVCCVIVPGRALLGCAFLRTPVCFNLKRDRPSRFVLPITALRLTPRSPAIWPDETPAHIRSFRSAMRSIVHVVSIIVLASITPNAAVHTPPPPGCGSNPRRIGHSWNGSCRTKPSDPSGHHARNPR